MSEARAPAADRSTALIVVGWILTTLTLVFPPLVIAAIGVGVVVRRQSHAQGVAIIAVALLACVASIYLASQTLVARD